MTTGPDRDRDLDDPSGRNRRRQDHEFGYLDGSDNVDGSNAPDDLEGSGDLDGSDNVDGPNDPDDLDDGGDVDVYVREGNDEDDKADTSEASAKRRVNRSARKVRVGRTWGRFAELWVPESLREARVDPGRRGALVLLLVAAVAAVATAVGVWRDQPEPRAVDTSVVAALAISSGLAPSDLDTDPGTAGSNGQADSSSTAGAGAPGAESPGDVAGSSALPAVREIVASVTGLVATPGLVTLPPGARVADAIAAAGGPAPDADLTGLNLAAHLADGDSVVIGSTPAAGGMASGVTGASPGGTPSAPGSVADATGLIDLNTADEAALDTLPGVGPVMAQNILAWRESNGRFSSIEQLQEISGIGPSRYAQISPLVTVS